MEPRVPRLLSWAVLGRVFGRGVAAVTLLAVVALVAWPERHRQLLVATFPECAARRPVGGEELRELLQWAEDVEATEESPGQLARRCYFRWHSPRVDGGVSGSVVVRDADLSVLLGR